MCVDPGGYLFRQEDIASSIRSPAFVISDNACVTVTFSACFVGDFLVTAKILCRLIDVSVDGGTADIRAYPTKGTFRTADVQRTLVACCPLRPVTSKGTRVALGFSMTV
jgi:hypothetical protein